MFTRQTRLKTAFGDIPMLSYDDGSCGDEAGRSLLSDPTGVEADLIDHNHATPKHAANTAAPKLTWDGRKGQWIPLAYSFSFPKGCFDHVIRTTTKVQARRLASYSFPPSRRHAIMLDQGSPKLRVIPRSDCKGRRPRVGFHALPLAIPHSPLATKQDRRKVPSDWGDESEEDDDDDDDDAESTVAWEPLDPFNLPSRPVQRMSWLDDIDIEDFLSSAIDYQQLDQVVRTLLPMNAPVIPGGAPTNIAGTKRMSPCTPCSPPPPIFIDDLRPIPDFRISPPRFLPPTAPS